MTTDRRNPFSPPKFLVPATALALTSWCFLAPGAFAGPGEGRATADSLENGQPETLTVTHEARALRPGEAVLLTIESSQALRSVKATSPGQDPGAFPAGADTRWQVLLGIDVETAPGPYRVSIEATTSGGSLLKAAHTLQVTARKFGTRRLTVDPKFVTPPPAVVPRIVREQERLKALFASVTTRAWQGPFMAPISGPSADNFGLQSVFNGVPRSRHRGVDYASPAGAPIAAPGAGRVVLAEDLYFTGNTVVIDHGGGLFSLLAHLSRIDVEVTETVERGVTVGLVGATGRVTGPHLHWTVRVGTAAIDPLSLLALGRSTT